MHNVDNIDVTTDAAIEDGVEPVVVPEVIDLTTVKPEHALGYSRALTTSADLHADLRALPTRTEVLATIAYPADREYLLVARDVPRYPTESFNRRFTALEVDKEWYIGRDAGSSDALEVTSYRIVKEARAR